MKFEHARPTILLAGIAMLASACGSTSSADQPTSTAVTTVSAAAGRIRARV